MLLHLWKKLGKSDLARLAIDYQNKFDTILNNINSELLDLKNKFTKLELDVEISRNANTRLVDRSQVWRGSAERKINNLGGNSSKHWTDRFGEETSKRFS